MVISESSCLCMQGRVSDGVCVGVHKLMGGGGGVCLKRRDAMALGEQVFHRLLTLPGGGGGGRVAGATSSVSGGVESEYSAVSTNVSALTRTPPL